jgi:hypothetical protein
MADRLFWVFLSRIWSPWRKSLVIVKPDTVVRWHRKGFKGEHAKPGEALRTNDVSSL